MLIRSYFQWSFSHFIGKKNQTIKQLYAVHRLLNILLLLQPLENCNGSSFLPHDLGQACVMQSVFYCNSQSVLLLILCYIREQDIYTQIAT